MVETGGGSITAMLAGMSSAELAYWRHIYETEFIGTDRAYLVGAKLESTYINSKLGENDEPVSPVDRIPFYPRDTDTADEDGIDAVMTAVIAKARDEAEERMARFRLEHQHDSTL